MRVSITCNKLPTRSNLTCPVAQTKRIGRGELRTRTFAAGTCAAARSGPARSHAECSAAREGRACGEGRAEEAWGSGNQAVCKKGPRRTSCWAARHSLERGPGVARFRGASKSSGPRDKDSEGVAAAGPPGKASHWLSPPLRPRGHVFALALWPGAAGPFGFFWRPWYGARAATMRWEVAVALFMRARRWGQWNNCKVILLRSAGIAST